MIATEFKQLPNELQRRICNMATYNPFRISRSIEKIVSSDGVYEVRETPITPSGTCFRISSSWLMCLNKNIELKFIHIRLHDQISNTTQRVMTFNSGDLEVSHPGLAEYIPSLMEAYESRASNLKRACMQCEKSIMTEEEWSEF